MSTNEQQLLAQWAAKGDAHAFDELVRRYADMVYGTCRRILQNDSDAEDATQESFLRMAQSASTVRSSVGGWLHAVATRESLQRLRADRRRREREQRFISESGSVEEPAWKDLEPWIDEAIAQLPNDLRLPVVASFLERKTHQEIADELGLDRSTVTRRIDRGIAAIRERLDKRNVSVSADKLAGLLAVELVDKAPQHLLSSLGRVGLAGKRGSMHDGQTAGKFAGWKVPTAAVLVVAIIGVAWWMTRSASPVPGPPAEAGDAAILSSEAQLETSAQLVADASGISDVEVEGEAEPQTDAPPVVAMVEEVPTRAISGQVTDSATGAGMANVLVRAQLLGREYGESATTDGNGNFMMEDVSPGHYLFRCGPVENYPETTHDVILAQVTLEKGEEISGLRIELNRGGVVEGRVLYKGAPLPNTTVNLSDLNNNLSRNVSSVRATFPSSITTDKYGRFRLEGLGEFDGEFIGRFRNAEGNSQSAVPFPFKVKFNEVTHVTIDFIGGGAVVEGYLYLGNTDSPLQTGLSGYFTWDDEGEFKEDIFWARSDETGYFRFGQMPEGNLELHVDYADSRYIQNIPVPANTVVMKEIVIPNTGVATRIKNVPQTARFILVVAHKGEEEQRITSVASFIHMRDTMAAADETSANGVYSLRGLEPGTYRVTAMAWPTDYNMSEVQEYGLEKFIEDVRYADAVIEIDDPNEQLKLELEFQSEN